MGVNERIEFVRKNSICYNCPAISHIVSECRSTFTCRYCGGRHNTLLHKPNPTINPQNDNKPSTCNTVLLYPNPVKQNQIRLDASTAALNIRIHGEDFPARALIDPASDFFIHF